MKGNWYCLCLPLCSEKETTHLHISPPSSSSSILEVHKQATKLENTQYGATITIQFNVFTPNSILLSLTSLLYVFKILKILFHQTPFSMWSYKTVINFFFFLSSNIKYFTIFYLRLLKQYSQRRNLKASHCERTFSIKSVKRNMNSSNHTL